MSADVVTGLSCPRCGGMVPIPEGQVVVVCPYCDLRSAIAAVPAAPAAAPAAPAAAPAAPAAAPATTAPSLPASSPAAPAPAPDDNLFEGFAHAVPQAPLAAQPRAEADALERRGVLRYQAPLRVDRQQAEAVMRQFLSGKVQVARDCAREAVLTEAFVVHLPFWSVWGRGLAYAFGQQKVGSGDNERWEPREKKAAREMSWNAPACEVGEFGVRRIGLEGCPMEPFNPDALHRTGMVFEPVGSPRAALEAARASFEDTIRKDASLSRVNQLFTRLTRPRLGLLYYPLWVTRYTYRGRAFQVVVDGVNGQVLYGKAPGSVGYRAAVLVGGMAVGSVVAVDVPTAILLSSSSDDDSPVGLALAAFVVGMIILGWAYRTFRHAEHYEYHKYKGKAEGPMGQDLEAMLPGELQQIGQAVLGDRR